MQMNNQMLKNGRTVQMNNIKKNKYGAIISNFNCYSIDVPIDACAHNNLFVNIGSKRTEKLLFSGQNQLAIELAAAVQQSTAE